MKNKIDLLERFEHLKSIDPSAEWNEKLLFRISHPGSKKHENRGSRLVLLALFLILAINIFSLSKNWFQERTLQNDTNLRVIASEYLISTNSSKY